MDNLVLVGATVIAVAIAVGATIAALRSGRRAARAADLVATLLDPPVVMAPADHPVTPTPREVPSAERSSKPDPAATFSDAEVARGAAPDRGDDSQPRIPVFDLERLRAWLTDENLRLNHIAVVSVEIDNLSDVNERLGYRAGEHLIEAITQRLRSVTRPRDVVAHVKQERFVLVCRDVPDRPAAEALTERVAMGVAHPSVVVSGVAEVTASIGVALAADAHETPERVLRRAIDAGNRARSLGGARIEIAADVPSPSLADAEFARALTNGELCLHYLPIVSCATGRIAGFETLVRWEHPERGTLLPGEFLPQAERNGAIVAVGSWAIEAACRQMAEWHRGTGTTLKLNMNLSAREFSEPTLPARIERVIREAGLPPGAVWLEITEATLLQDRERAERTLNSLHEIGVRLVIDDFGAGASSLVSLKQFPLDAIKIDRAFVADLGAHRDSDAICRAIVELAHSLGLGAIAEGVETMEQYASLRAIGCELGQGRLFGPARPAADYGDTPSATLGVAPTVVPRSDLV